MIKVYLGIIAFAIAVVQTVFITLKLTGFINWGWLCALLPALITLSAVLLLLFLLYCLSFLLHVN